MASKALPSPGEIVQQKILESVRPSSLNLARAFGGISDPSTIWTEMVGDGRSAFALYREIEEKDDDVGGLLEDLKVSVLRMERQIVPADDSQLALDIAGEIEAQFKALPSEQNAMYAILDAVGYGVVISEMIFDVSESQVRLLDIRDRAQELFSFNSIWKPQVGPLRYDPTARDPEGGAPVPEQKFVVWTWRQRAGIRRGRPVIRSVFWPSWFKRQCLKFWLRYGEKGPGTAVVKYKSGASEAEQNEALKLAEALVQKIAVAVPHDFEVASELLSVARSQNPDTYAKLVERMEESIARRILGQTLTSRGSEGGAGSFALGQVHERVKQQRVEEFANALEHVANTQIVARLVLWNHGPDAPAPRYALVRRVEESLTERIDVDRKAQAMGVPITESYMREKYGFPAPKEDDVALEPRALAAPAGEQQFAARLPEDVASELRDVQRILDEMRARSLGAFARRVKQVVAEQIGEG